MSSDKSLVLRLASLINDAPASIEILPSAFEELSSIDITVVPNPYAPFALNQGHLGVPKKFLYRCYVAALNVFASAKKQTPIDTHGLSLTAADLEASSAAILLANPAHMTALNWRKRLIQKGSLHCHKELAIIASLLSSRNCANQSVLWHHRQWLLQRMYNPNHVTPLELSKPTYTLAQGTSGGSSNLPISPEALKKEIEITTQACELYPRNYYAWAHRWWCIQRALTIYRSPVAEHSVDGNAHVQLLADEVAEMRIWLEGHISDYSAVHYLTRLERSLTRLSGDRQKLLETPDDSSNKAVSIVGNAAQHATHLTVSFPSHESLWLYLRFASYRTQADVDSAESLARKVLLDGSKMEASYAYRYLALRDPGFMNRSFGEGDARKVFGGNNSERPDLNDSVGSGGQPETSGI